jgi:xanthine dehydrogenase accessory factor
LHVLPSIHRLAIPEVAMEIYEELVKLKKLGRPSALATIVECKGSSPQKQGAKMLVRDDGSILGTLGGGCIEAEVIQHAKMAMQDGCPRTVPFQLTEKAGGLVCGGNLLVYIEPALADPRLVILGAGHVGKALATLARFSGFTVIVTDDRPEYANKDTIPDAHELVVLDFPAVFSRVRVDQETFLVIATRGHNHDLDAVKAALRTNAGYIGLLGSRRKKGILMNALRGAGFSPDDITRVVVPVGLPIGSVTPEEIAVSIMAQIIQHRREHARTGRGNRPCGGAVAQDGPTQAAPAGQRHAGH